MNHFIGVSFTGWCAIKPKPSTKPEQGVYISLGKASLITRLWYRLRGYEVRRVNTVITQDPFIPR